MHPFHAYGSEVEQLRARLVSLGIRGGMIAGRNGVELLPVSPPHCLQLFEFDDRIPVEPVNGRDQQLNVEYFKACVPLL